MIALNTQGDDYINKINSNQKRKSGMENKEEIGFEQIIERGCGIEVHKEVIVATIRGSGIEEKTKTYSGFTESIETMREWLRENKITHIAMESTGIYWKPIYNILESEFEIILVNAKRHFQC